eukprot:1658147-Lingulodinium_polyedra.AAC.1
MQRGARSRLSVWVFVYACLRAVLPVRRRRPRVRRAVVDARRAVPSSWLKSATVRVGLRRFRS